MKFHKGNCSSLTKYLLTDPPIRASCDCDGEEYDPFEDEKMDEFDIGCLMSDLANNDDALDEIIITAINDDRFRTAVAYAIVTGDGDPLVDLFEDTVREMATETKYEMRPH